MTGIHSMESYEIGGLYSIYEVNEWQRVKGSTSPHFPRPPTNHPSRPTPGYRHPYDRLLQVGRPCRFPRRVLLGLVGYGFVLEGPHRMVGRHRVDTGLRHRATEPGRERAVAANTNVFFGYCQPARPCMSAPRALVRAHSRIRSYATWQWRVAHCRLVLYKRLPSLAPTRIR